MISCTEFIPAYSELFKFIEQKAGEKAVLDYWHHISEKGLNMLRDLVIKHGIRGCFMYWSHTLNEEAADFTMTLDEEVGEFRIVVHHCPSKGRLLEHKHIEPYHNYCGHCDVLYRRILEPLGFEYIYDMSECDRAKCSLTVRKR